MTYEQITADLKKKIYAPVYFLCGEEPYYIDLIADKIENEVLSEGEKEFNQTVVYGKDLDVLTLISYARRYPMMSNYQVVIVKEAQDMRGLISKASESEKQEEDKDKGKSYRDLLLEYIKQPTQSTILVFCYKYKSLDKRKSFYKELNKHGVYFESARLYDNKIPGWIQTFISASGYKIGPKATQLIADCLGNDLSKISNEIEKLKIHLKPGDEITSNLIQEHIGLSKEFNVFELNDALGKRNAYRANLIVQYFNKNPKSSPLVLTLPQLCNYFIKTLTYHTLSDRSKDSVAKALGIHPFFVNDYETSARSYSREECMRNIAFLREYDNRSKGVNNLSADSGQLLKELVSKILN
ncbi:MAG: DNA polymerase III subunit delta [Bacteroidetes bacterium]|nr:MAG: DNA polymerase III subunit delta [Bacteroidota bacterium]REK06542.1 MAG: DNA polymerase III subunit delta [Bacteroidota bacterium]REK33308.1 MAG: DNA polymerase III subunit delta [Bacteroidota bacterium]REK49708.1 MAG: DNA polymerase III subunit delta [Bacteroidota bacterium]